MYETYIIAFTAVFFAMQILYGLFTRKRRQTTDKALIPPPQDHKEFIRNKPGAALHSGKGSIYIGGLCDFRYADLTKYMMALPIKDISNLLMHVKPQQKKYLLENLPLHRQVATKLKEISSNDSKTPEVEVQMLPLQVSLKIKDQKALGLDRHVPQRNLQTLN